MTHLATPPVTWQPTNPANTQMFRFAHWLTDTHGVDVGPLITDDGEMAPGLFRRLHAWSIHELPVFWDAVREYFGVLGDGFDTAALTNPTMPGAVWYPQARVNLAENVLERTRELVEDDATALVNIDENNRIHTVSWQQLRTRVHGLAEQLRELGVQPGDRVAAVLPNNAEAIIGLLASATIGAVWTINSPDLTPTATLARLRQLEPAVLITTGGYTFNGRHFDLANYNAELRAGLPSVDHHLDIADYRQAPSGPVDYLRGTFDHPLWILFSSGTTGDPKGIVHGHGGMLLESLKGQGLHQDMTPADRYYVAANTSWMVWNTLVQALAVGASVVVYGGSPKINGAARQFEVIAATDTTRFAVGAPYLTMVERSGIIPAERWDLTGLKSILSTAAPLPESTWRWVHEHVNPVVRLGSDSGGTDICSGFVGTNPLEPIHLGELQGPMLGVAAKSFDDDGHEVFNEVGELVITEPMPSMPLYLWNDADGERYRDTYFNRFPATEAFPHGVWAQGDWVIQTSRGSFIVEGRSDATLNRQGVRLGTAEIYAALSYIPEVEQSTVIGVEQPGGGYWMPLFVQLAEGTELTDELQDRIADTIRTQASMRHVPDEIISMADIPVTHSGKRIEVPLKKLFIRGTADVVNQDAIANPASLTEFVQLAQRRAIGAPE
ncbi:acetoacetate--CoA ligase [Enteractinococcus coprophilus]|uniref:Acetoacetyl-CoA synthetase n=1 Tax=Enteractinococcus coprophilus TaxID=1027633 RepID=A0A543AGK8_9MICC|nr:acetoacetate--CoA ligase [Enteractinococcus coprophilus]TQL71718.1 acetoacetyl-CoA synthetase [Enteractinococcus coprophilus]